jgi:hypothetical protein
MLASWPNGNAISSGGKQTTLQRLAAYSPAQASDVHVLLDNVMLDESSVGDAANSIINLPVGATHVQFSAALRYNNLAGSTGVFRRIWIEMDDGTGSWGTQVPCSLAEQLYVAASTGDVTPMCDTPKMSVAYLNTVYGTPVTRFRLMTRHDSGGTVGLSAMGPAGTASAYMTANFFQ